MYSDAVVLRGSDRKHRTLGSFYYWVKGASFFIEECDVLIEIDVERSPLIIQSKTCKECMKKLSETKTFESIQLTNWRQIDSGTITTIVSCICAVVNPRRACAVRVTVVILCVCLSVCQYLFSHYRLRGGL